jgi:hypothetical protein
MHPSERALLDVPLELAREITRFGGPNPHGKPMWRVVRAENVLEQRFGQMRHMPVVSADCDDLDIEPERFSSGEMWTPRYDGKGWCLERWFPASAWGSQVDWEHETSLDGETRMTGEFPRHGDWFMVNDEFFAWQRSTDFWKTEILKWIRAREFEAGDEASKLSRTLYLSRWKQEKRAEEYAEEVNRIHRGIVDPTLATIGRTAQRVRDGLMEEMGATSHLPAG